LKSLSIRLYEGEGFQVVPADFDTILAEDEATGWVYILRSLSEDPAIASRQNLYKIGFTTKSVSQRIANASREPTYLMAPVEVLAEYRTYNVKASALEHLLHRVFADARLDVSQVGLDGKAYDSTEWFEVPLSAIDKAVDLIMTGEIVDYLYDVGTNSFLPIRAY
ncbi:GIY-YIG nuclease family protein, partial [Pontimonas sp.]